jgi:hypothetical protein
VLLKPGLIQKQNMITGGGIVVARIRSQRILSGDRIVITCPVGKQRSMAVRRITAAGYIIK